MLKSRVIVDNSIVALDEHNKMHGVYVVSNHLREYLPMMDTLCVQLILYLICTPARVSNTSVISTLFAVFPVQSA